VNSFNDEQNDSTDEAKSSEEEEEQVEDDEEEVAQDSEMKQKIIQFENDTVLDVGDMLFYLSMDWIDIQNAPPEMVVTVSATKNQTLNDFSLSVDEQITLDDCLKLFNEPEVLGPQNCWFVVFIL